MQGLPNPMTTEPSTPAPTSPQEASIDGRDTLADESVELSDGQAGDVAQLLEGPIRIRSWVLMLLLLLALVFALRAAREFLLPVFVAVHVQFVLGPIVRWMGRLRMRPPLAAGLLLVGLTGVLAGGGVLLWEPATEWFDEMPRSMRSVQRKLEALREPVEQMSEASKSVEQMTSLEKDPPVRVVADSRPSFAQMALSGTRAFLANCLIATVLLYFMLAGQDSFLTKLVTVLPRLRDKKLAVAVVRSIEQQVSRYLVSITLINTCLGIAVGTALWGLGMPNAPLWGIMAGLFNFVPYLGTAVGVGLVALAGLLSFDTPGAGLLPAAAYLALSSLEGLLITPSMLGHGLRLSPVVLFIWLMLWTWVWGIPGAMLAVPMLVIVHITFENVPSLQPFGAFLRA